MEQDIEIKGTTVLYTLAGPDDHVREVGSAVTLAMLGYVLVGFQYSAAAYITALTIDFFTVIFGFVVALDVIMQQPMEVSERPTPH